MQTRYRIMWGDYGGRQLHPYWDAGRATIYEAIEICRQFAAWERGVSWHVVDGETMIVFTA